MENAGYFAVGQIGNFVVILAALVAIAVAIFKYRKLGTAAIFAILGFGILLLECLLSFGYSAYVTFLMDRSGLESFRTISTVFSIVRAILAPASVIFLILAVFWKRPTDISQK